MLPPRACCAPSHQLWARTARGRCECIFVSSAAAVNVDNRCGIGTRFLLVR
uniref:Uncharacterized protein n=1 Tax=Hyaloperonospora arabidopsidis (strain Emoy2) TaxID=559515 RepID=M4C0W9_HYAAE